MTMNNAIVSFLHNNPAPCERSVCTTCGGRLHFLIRLRKAFPNDDTLAANLKNLKGSDLAELRNDQSCMPHVLNLLPAEIRESIFAVWMANITNDSDLALVVLLWTEFGKQLSQERMLALLKAAEARLLLSRKLRDNLRKSLQPEMELPAHLSAVIEQDKQEEEAYLKRAYIAAKERHDYLNSLSAMSFAERVPRIVADQTIQYQDWRDAWSICTDADVEKLDSSSVQNLIELCETNQSYRWTEALKKIYDKRHQLRYVAIDKIKHQFGHLTPSEQLLELIRNYSVPIEHYPIELAQCITSKWISTLSEEERNYFLELLCNTRLRVWKKVCARLNDDKMAK